VRVTHLLQCYVLDVPRERDQASVDLITAELLDRVKEGEVTCELCRATVAAAGVVGYFHGDYLPEPAALAICRDCVKKLGCEEAAAMMSRAWVDQRGGGEVHLLKASRA
jgi:hypothetical protein